MTFRHAPETIFQENNPNPGPAAYDVDNGFSSSKPNPYRPKTTTRRKPPDDIPDPGPGAYNTNVSAFPTDFRTGFTIGERPAFIPTTEFGEWLQNPGPGEYLRSARSMGGLSCIPDTAQVQIPPEHKEPRFLPTPGPADYSIRGAGMAAGAKGVSMVWKASKTKHENWTKPCVDTPGPGEYDISLGIYDRKEHSCGGPEGPPDSDPAAGRDLPVGADGPGPAAYSRHDATFGRAHRVANRKFSKLGTKTSWPHAEPKVNNGVPGPGAYKVSQHFIQRTSHNKQQGKRKDSQTEDSMCLDSYGAVDPEDGPGPGMYKTHRQLGAPSSVYADSPKCTLGSAPRVTTEVNLDPTPGPGSYNMLKGGIGDRTSHRRECLQMWTPAPEKSQPKGKGMELLPRQMLSGLVQPSSMPILPLGNLPALLRIASQNPALAEAFQERCETLAAANPALIPFIEELHTSAGIGLVRTVPRTPRSGSSTSPRSPQVVHPS